MQFQLNGVTRHYDDDPDLPLLTYLRDHEHIISPKDGCAPQAACGCCAVDLNGKAVLSCVITMAKVEGGEVTTIEGLSERNRRALPTPSWRRAGCNAASAFPAS